MGQAIELQEKCAETCSAPFRAPELFDVKSDALIDERTDVWSLGCLLFNIAYRQMPFDGTLTSAIGKIPFPAQDR
jgi:serine/threonine kinase 16